MRAVRTWPDTVPPDNRTLGWHVLEWTADHLEQPDGENAGEPWIFTGEQARIVLRWYEIDDQGRFVHRRGVVRRMKGWGKDPFLAAIAAAELCGPCRFDGWARDGSPKVAVHPAPWIQVAAVSKDQTRNTMTLFPGLFSDETITEYGLDIGKEVIHTARGGRIEAVTSSPRSLEGGRPTLVIANETHHWVQGNEGLEMAAAIRRNLAKSNRGTARVMEITNAHDPEEASAASATYEAWVAGKRAGVYYDSIEAPLIERAGKPVSIDDLSDRQVRDSIEAARQESVWLDVDRLLGEIRDPVSPDAARDESQKRRFYFNQIWAAEAETWILRSTWDACEDRREIPDGASVVLAVDGSFNGDATGIIVATAGDAPYVDVVECWEPPEDASPDWRVPILAVDDMLRTCAKRWRVLEMAFDPYRYQHTMAVLADEGHMVVEFHQTAPRMTPATIQFEQLVQSRGLTHSGDERLTRHVMNAVVRDDARGRRIQKVNKWSKLRIDLAVATIMAVNRATSPELVPPSIW